MAGETILIIDDDMDIREIITLYLEKEGYITETASDGLEAVSKASKISPHLIILDMMLPGLDGIEVCQEIRRELLAPIIFLSCKNDPIDKSIALSAGGDDYMSKPFEPIELLARVKAHLRRSRISQSSQEKKKLLRFPGLTIDASSLSVIANGKNINLSPKEFKLLFLLAERPHTVLSSEFLYESLWGVESHGDNRTVMVHISNIRKKIERNPANPLYLITVKGAGYKFCVPNDYSFEN